MSKKERIKELKERVFSLEGRLAVRARFRKPHEHAYDDYELREMFGPYLLDGDTSGLSPRECRLLETIEALKEELLDARNSDLPSKESQLQISSSERLQELRQMVERYSGTQIETFELPPDKQPSGIDDVTVIDCGAFVVGS